MALFKSNPEKAIQREIDAAHTNRERVSARLAECDHAIGRNAVAAKDCALIGDDAGLDVAEASLRSAQDRAVTLRSALTELDQQLANLELTKAEMADRKVRAETAAEIERLVRNLTEVGAEFNATAERLSEVPRLGRCRWFSTPLGSTGSWRSVARRYLRRWNWSASCCAPMPML